MADEEMNRGSPPPAAADNPNNNNEDGGVIGSAALRPVFLGNLVNNYTAQDVKECFERPQQPRQDDNFAPVPVERVDLKKGYCFVFLQDATSEEDKKRVEAFVSAINGMSVPNVSNALRAEFARGDGRIKRKEDDRRARIQPSETLFVVNFHEETTRREDLQMLFEPFGELVRIDMKRNYAFVQFRSVEEASRAKEVTNGGKLDQSVLTVEFVARQRGDGGNDGGRRRDRDRDRRRNDRRGPPPPDPYRRGGRRDDGYRRRSPPRYERRRGSSRSRSRSPPRYRSRSPPRRDYYYDDDRRRDYRDRSPDGYRGRRSPDREYRSGDRDRGYR